MQGRYHAAGSSNSAPTSPADRGATGGRQWSTASSTEGMQSASFKLVLWVGLLCNLHGGATLAWALMQMLVMCASDPSLTYMLCCAMLLLCVTELSFGASSSGRRGVTSPVPPDGSSTALHQHSPGGLSRLRSAHNSLVTGQGAESFTSCFESAVGDGYWFAH